ELCTARTGPAAVVAVVLLAASIAAVVTAIWTADPSGASVVRDGAAAVRTAWEEPSWRAAAAAAAGIVGIALIVLAVAPGRRRRHGRAGDRVELVVDDGLLADAAAQAVARHCMLPSSQVSATVTTRHVRVRIRPVSGVPVDRAGAAEAAHRALERVGFGIRPVVTVDAKGVVA
ncbi:MAG: hypothetical protein B7X41_21380, partial [Microbacterium sp. 14-71-5]